MLKAVTSKVKELRNIVSLFSGRYRKIHCPVRGLKTKPEKLFLEWYEDDCGVAGPFALALIGLIELVVASFFLFLGAIFLTAAVHPTDRPTDEENDQATKDFFLLLFVFLQNGSIY